TRIRGACRKATGTTANVQAWTLGSGPRVTRGRRAKEIAHAAFSAMLLALTGFLLSPLPFVMPRLDRGIQAGTRKDIRRSGLQCSSCTFGLVRSAPQRLWGIANARCVNSNVQAWIVGSSPTMTMERRAVETKRAAFSAPPLAFARVLPASPLRHATA